MEFRGSRRLIVLETPGDECKLVASREELTVDQVVASAKAVRSCMLNKLMILMSSHVCIANPALPVKMEELRREWLKHRSEDGEEILIQIFTKLFESKKSTILYDLVVRYCLPPHGVANQSERRSIHLKLLEKFNTCTRINGVVSDGNEYDCELCLRKFKESLDEVDLNCFFWLSYLDGKHQEIVKILQSKNNEIVNSLIYFYKSTNQREKTFYLYQAILTLIYSNEFVEEPGNRSEDPRWIFSKWREMKLCVEKKPRKRKCFDGRFTKAAIRFDDKFIVSRV